MRKPKLSDSSQKRRKHAQELSDCAQKIYEVISELQQGGYRGEAVKALAQAEEKLRRDADRQYEYAETLEENTEQA